MELLDEMQVEIDALAGSGMGAVIGLLDATGQSGRQLRQLIDDYVVRENEDLFTALRRLEAFRWMEFLAPEPGNGGLLSGNRFVDFSV